MKRKPKNEIFILKIPMHDTIQTTVAGRILWEGRITRMLMDNHSHLNHHILTGISMHITGSTFCKWEKNQCSVNKTLLLPELSSVFSCTCYVISGINNTI